MNDIIELDPSQDPRWDEFVRVHPLGQIYHHSGWREVLESCFGHIRGRFLVRVGGPDARILAGLPIYEVRSWLLGTRLISAPFATLFDPLVEGPEDLAALLDRVTDLAREKRARYVEIRSLDAGPWFAGSGFGETRYYVHHTIDLGAPLETLWRSFHRSCVRQRISRSESSGLKIRTGRDESDIKAFHGLLAMTRRRRSLPAQPFRFIKALWDVFGRDDRLRLLLAEKDGRIAAGLLLLVFRDRVTAELLASDDSFNGISPVHGLFWHAIQWAHREGFRTFDFGRTSPANKSLLEFKGHWGTAVRELPQFFFPAEAARNAALVEASWKYKAAKALASRKTPRLVYEWAGSVIYRHLG